MDPSSTTSGNAADAPGVADGSGPSSSASSAPRQRRGPSSSNNYYHSSSRSPRGGIRTASETWASKSQRLHRPVPSPAHFMNDEQVEAMLANFATQDAVSGAKTWTRIAVEKFFSKYNWYFPRRAGHSGRRTAGPSLSKAYAYYEHVTLPRRYVGDNGLGKAEHVQRRADPGESEPTELYSMFTTPASAFIEWGVGMDLYFSTLRMMSLVLLVAGLVNVPNVLFYRSTEYSPDGRTGTSWTLDTSAVCTSWEWVVCNDCGLDRPYAYNTNKPNQPNDKILFTVGGETLVQRNDCSGGQFPQGMLNWGTGIFLVIMVSLISLYLLAREIRSDEDKATATDYSIVVRNPPKDAYDPDVWHAFFSQYADKQVTVVTVALDNHELLRRLVQRRRHLRSLKLMLPRGVDLEDEDTARAAVAQFVKDQETDPPGFLIRALDCLVFPFLRPFGMFLKADTLVNNIFRLKSEIEELQSKGEFDVASVFVTFETEEGQRAALEALSTGKIYQMSRNISHAAPGSVFQGKLLKVHQAAEPSSIRWLDLGASTARKLTVRIVNLVITCGVISLAGFCVARVRTDIGPAFSGPLVSIFNSVIPLFIKILMIFERHVTEGSYQTSLYLKITLFRWVNTAILTKLITPFTSTVSDGSKDVLPQINAILWAELWLTPGLRLLDLVGNIRKHVLAPRAMNQETMNLNFQGTPVNMGERYTDMTKVLFLVFFYSALFPAVFFFGFAILTVQYFADKYCLLRIWAWSPNIGSELAKFSRRYFYSGALLAYFLVSAYAWAQFPYDNLCDPTEPYRIYGNSGQKAYRSSSGGIEVITVNQDWAVEFCNQNWIDSYVFPFPPTPRLQPPTLKWMDSSQEKLTTVYGWTALVAVVAFVVIFFGSAITRYILSWFQGVYRPKGQNQHIDFSSDPDIDGYVPQVRAGGFPFPFIACDVHDIDESLIGWKDTARSYDDYNLIFDVPWQGMPVRRGRADPNGQETGSSAAAADQSTAGGGRTKPIYSIVKHYRTPWQVKLANDASEAATVKSDQLSL